MTFIKGKTLSKKFFHQKVAPILQNHFPNLPYSAALIGPGSDVIGFDTERSTDHDWGPRVMLFLRKKDYQHKEEMIEILSQELPPTFLDYPTHFQAFKDDNVKIMQPLPEGKKLNLGVKIYTIKKYFKGYLGINPKKKIKPLDWLCMSEHKLRTIKDGEIFHDDLGLKNIQQKLAYYPKDIWLFLMASEWMKIGQEEPFMGRCGEVGDELGSRLVAARLVKSLMSLCFLMDREYIPYSKWFGTAFSRLSDSEKLKKIFFQVLNAEEWQEREKWLSHAYLHLANKHNQLKITPQIPAEILPFHDRPFQIIDGGKYTEAIMAEIQNDFISQIQPPIGSVNQITNTVDLLESNALLKKLGNVFK